jgi:hypothetical protein
MKREYFSVWGFVYLAIYTERNKNSLGDLLLKINIKKGLLPGFKSSSEVDLKNELATPARKK